MSSFPENLSAAFCNTARRVPAYRTLLAEAGIVADEIKNFEDFRRLPVLEKKNTFSRFGIEELCVDGKLGTLGSVLTSSGHSGVFAFGLTGVDDLDRTALWIDDLLDHLFAVRSQRTLLINCLPMGVKVPTRACTLAETSVRPDMVLGLVRAFGPHYQQIILVGETAFIKHVAELGLVSGVDWKKHLVQIVVGEEPLAENARKYLEGVFGMVPGETTRGIIFSSMGVAELGLNLFSEVPPLSLLIPLRRILHEDAELRAVALGRSDWVPSLFTYDSRRIFVEFDAFEKLIVTTLDPTLRIPLIRYASGDSGRIINIPPSLRPRLEAAGISWEALMTTPIIAIFGRGHYALSGSTHIYPEAVKEGVYYNAHLVPLTTANFRLNSGSERVKIRLQLSPGVTPDINVQKEFQEAIAHYVRAPFDLVCEPYETFVSGMSLDYERKFNYLEHVPRPLHPTDMEKSSA